MELQLTGRYTLYHDEEEDSSDEDRPNDHSAELNMMAIFSKFTSEVVVYLIDGFTTGCYKCSLSDCPYA